MLTRILVVDDEASVREILVELLTDDGYEVVAAASGEEALLKFRSGGFAVVITDIRMGEVSGLEVLRQVRELDSQVQVVLMTSYASMDTAVSALRAGAFDYLMKPFEELDVVTETVKRAATSVRLAVENKVATQILKQKNSELERSNRQLRDLAILDGLTGLYNHRYLQQELEKELARAARHGRDLSVIFVDVDHFKKFNDTHGHQAGDEVLKKVAGLLKANLKKGDIVARYGGEEFVIILPDAGKQAALDVAERLCEVVRTAPLAGRETQPSGRLTVSAGVASFAEDGSNNRDLLLAADRALYRAKQSGRDCVVVARSDLTQVAAV